MFQNFYKWIKQSPLALISILIAAANWQLLSGWRATQWDMINFWLPWRHYIAQCYTSGIVPLWNPYSQAGYPIHGDLQGPAYSMEAILTSFLSPINIYFLNFLYIFYLILGAYGFYKLVLFFIRTLPDKQLTGDSKNNSLVAVVAAVCFALCGYNSWHGHYLYVMISVCLLPWLYYYFFRILDKGTWTDALKLAFFLWWQVTAGNPSFIIVSFYFLLIIWACRFVVNIRKKRSAENKKAVLLITLTGIVSLLLCAPVFLNAYYVFPETSRSGGIALDWAAEENLIWRNVFALFSSLVGYEREMHSGAEQPTYNLYLGIPALLFAFFGIWKFRSFWINVFSAIAIIALLLSLGLQTPLYGLFHRFLPFFNVFRMPNLIIIYTLIYIAVMAALGMLYLLKNGISTRTWLIFSAVVIGATCFAVVYFKYIYVEKQNDHITEYSSIRAFMWSASQARKAAITLVITTVVLAVGYVAVRKKNYKALLVVLVIDACFNYNLGAIARVVSDTSAAYTNSFLKGLPKGFHPPDNIQDNKVSSLTNRMNALWMNTATFLQQPVHLNDNNFELSNYMQLYNDHKEELNYFTRQPLAFLADSLVKDSEFIPIATGTDTLQEKVIATLPDSIYTKYKNLHLQRSPDDTIIIREFLPQHFVIQVKNRKPVALILQQNLTKLWKIDAAHSVAFHSFPFIPLKAGTHRIEFTYEVPHFSLLFMLSLITGALVMLIIVWYRPGTKGRILPTIGLLIVFGYCGYSFVKGGKELADQDGEEYAQYLQELSKKYPTGLEIINCRDTPSGGLLHYNLFYNEEIASFLQQLRDCKNDYVIYTCYCSLHAVETEALIHHNYGEPVAEKKFSRGFICVYKRHQQLPATAWSKSNDFETATGPWALKDTVANNTRLLIMKGNEYGGGMDFILKDAGAAAHDLIYAECELETNETEMPGFCMSIDRDGVSKAFVGYGNVHLKGNKKTAFIYRLPEWVKETDKVTLFYWNNTGKPAIIDNMKVQVIKMD